MTQLRVDSIGGASGDMTLAALCAAGADADAMRDGLGRLGIEAFSLDFEEAEDRGLRGLRARVRVHDAAHPHRGLDDILALLRDAKLPGRAGELAEAVFRRLGEAEARVHGVPVERVHFHEVGAMDSIIDIVGACLAVDGLGVTAVNVGPLPVGRGTVRAAHGVLPLPVPATAELLRDWPLEQTDEPFELVTPTGAALLTTLSRLMPADRTAALRLVAAGYGFGSRTLNGRANALRAMLLQGDRPAAGDTCLVLETNIDDTTPELVGALAADLLAAGALDVFTTAVQMKKQRPGMLLTVLCRDERREALLERIFLGSTTFGVREYTARRWMLERTVDSVHTPYGTVRRKHGAWRGRPVTAAPEYEDCVARAREHGVTPRQVYEAALRAG
jgi:uncharacterized protein (TIGR00299 family) protein